MTGFGTLPVLFGRIPLRVSRNLSRDFAAGMILYLSSHEITPEIHRSGHQNKATFGLSIGLVILLFLGVWLE